MQLESNNWKFIFRALGISPLVFSVALLIFYLNTWLLIDHPPSYDMPDPKSVGVYFLYFPLVFISMFASMVTVPFSLVLLLIYLIVHQRRSSWQLVTYVLLVNATAVFISQTEMLNWFLD
jgi:hypothetical protein